MEDQEVNHKHTSDGRQTVPFDNIVVQAEQARIMMIEHIRWLLPRAQELGVTVTQFRDTCTFDGPPEKVNQLIKEIGERKRG